MASGHRLAGRALVVARAFTARISSPGLTAAPKDPRRILVAHHLLLGDTLMLTPLLAKLRALHPQAKIILLADPAFVPLYATQPYGVRALPFEPRDTASVSALLRETPVDLAIVPGDNRFSWLAAAMGARHIVAHAGDRPASKNWFIDDLRPYPSTPSAWGDMVAALVEGPEPAPFTRGDWPAPEARAFDAPTAPYAVLHVGASTSLKRWGPERWAEIARELERRGITPVWSAGAKETALVAECDPEGRYPSFAGKLDLAQLWQLLAGATVLLSPDTGVAHLGRLAFVPTVTLYGPGSSVIVGRGRFWRDTPGRDVTIDPFACRDQKILFRREIEWVRRCGRSLAECPEPRCMQALTPQAVLEAMGAVASGRR
ncbi:glycosyltransferase family 9 protein [Usitatibacter palustris]|uniref:ADP-heptose:LPS heptosyltransferase n=1 Tax=Usitatibacter palustris TaxID=2732487 RepID=A0A6M4H9M6_9PROT|nr:glycosyltransferase family 9 protein [Usitatibacter palustris]QJR16459.1 hypothetical protein DSM104440_03294 [Usitatibacter palustris]